MKVLCSLRLMYAGEEVNNLSRAVLRYSGLQWNTMHLCVAKLCLMRGKKALKENVCCARIHFTLCVNAALVAQQPGEVAEAAPDAQHPGDDVDAEVAALVEQRRQRGRSRKPQQPHLLRSMLMMSPQLRLVMAQVEETSGTQSLPRSHLVGDSVAALAKEPRRCGGDGRARCR